MKRTAVFLCLCLALSGCAAREEPIEQTYENAAFTAAVISDLHYETEPSDFNAIVPLEPLGREVTDALFQQIAELKPDAVILTGDNTNSGKESEMKELGAKLQILKDAGIEVIAVPGNHDCTDSGMRAYEKYIRPLCDITERDASTFSYVMNTHGIAVYAMDDSGAAHGGGYFPEDTMAWLENSLAENAGRRPVLFVSHHNVLSAKAEPLYAGSAIENVNLYDVLKDAGVRLCLSGHQHSQIIYEYENMYEIVGRMPFSAARTFGFLTMDDKGVSYQTVPVDLEEYGEEGLVKKAEAYIEKQTEQFFAVFDAMCEEKGLSDPDSRGVCALIQRCFENMEDGMSETEADEIRRDPYYEMMRNVLAGENYGPWLEDILRHPQRDASRLNFSW